MLVDEFLPTYDVSDSVATVVHADVATTWDALMDVDLIEVGRKRPLVGVLGAIRILPDIVSQMLHGELPQRPPAHLRLRDTTSIAPDEGGWVLLGERPRDEIALEGSSGSSGGRSSSSRRSAQNSFAISRSLDMRRPFIRCPGVRWTSTGQCCQA